MKLYIRFITVCIVTTFFFGCATESNVEPNSKVTQYGKFVSEMKAKGLETGNILIYENEEIVFTSSNGLRSINPLDTLTLNSQFRLASVSKQFTGMSIVKLKEEGRLSYNQKVNSILTDFPYDNITVKHLLHHISGLTDYEQIVEDHFVPEDSTKRYILGNDEILEVFFRVHPELDFQPGEKWEYCNTGYLVLASIVEKISGQHFRDFLKENIFDPIGMTNTTLYNYQIEADPNMQNRVFGYRLAFNQSDLILNDYDIVNDVRGDGGIYSTLNDLYKWNMALVNYTFVPKEYLYEAWSGGQLNNGEKTRYGFGWKFPKDKTLPKTVFHAGGWVGFGTYLYNEVETKSGYVVLTNNSSNAFRTITDAIDSIRANAPYNSPKLSIAKAMTKLIYSKNSAEAIDFYREKKNDSANYYTNEMELNSMGYNLLQRDKLEEAMVVFELNIKEFPESANTYDSYGDALLMQGDSLKALESFQTCYRMDTSLTYMIEKIEMVEGALK